MNNLEELLKKKSEELTRQEQANLIEKEKLESEQRIAHTRLLENERRQKTKEFTQTLIRQTLKGCLIGVVIGAIIGFGKGCIRYDYVPPSIDGGDSFYVPFRYILPNMFSFGIIGTIIGLVVGLIEGSIKTK